MCKRCVSSERSRCDYMPGLSLQSPDPVLRSHSNESYVELTAASYSTARRHHITYNTDQLLFFFLFNQTQTKQNLRQKQSQQPTVCNNAEGKT